MKPVYFDHAATTPVHPEVVSAMLSYFGENFGNASSLHFLGQEAARAVEEAREKVARLINCDPREIIFTGSGTEADNFALKGIAEKLKARGNHIITSSIEHHAVEVTCRYLEKKGFKVTYLPVDRYGLVDPDDLKREITEQTILISIMHANNEVGTIQPIKELAQIAHEKGVLFHTDAVQTVGSIPVDVRELGVDLLSLSAHKFYGPKGVGALFLRKGVAIEPLIHGGGQEKNLRAGTTNVPGIVGLGKAAELASKELSWRMEHSLSLRERLIKGLEEKLTDFILTGHREKRLPGNVSICVDYIEGESMLLLLSIEGFACSSGSACTSGSLEPSHVLLAMGIDPQLAQGSLRITLGRENTEEEIDRFLETLPKVVKRLREMSPFKPKK
ncbi:MAG: cysteine desulfurase NifS [Caldiserica bacterium]|jgi:cysteine desulfurase|nr:cysteine desulfurase NifS [Caldisericota bacterium]MDH7562098.1 cysteine desulfurase NifS [Caldisericota bacterium]